MPPCDHRLYRALPMLGWRLRGLLRRLTPDTRAGGLGAETDFWRQWLASEGLEWPEDYRNRFDPAAPVQEHVSAYIDRLAGERVEILDVGAGPVTKLGKVHPSKTLAITAVDVLADRYNRMLADHGLTPPVVTQAGDAQKLQQQFGERQFDIVHSQNALDHTEDAVAALGEMLVMTRPGGFVVLLHEENEGRNESYFGLHKWDFTCDGGRFIVAGPGPGGPRHDIADLFSSEADIECSFRHGDVLVGIRKRSEPV